MNEFAGLTGTRRKLARFARVPMPLPTAQGYAEGECWHGD